MKILLYLSTLILSALSAHAAGASSSSLSLAISPGSLKASLDSVADHLDTLSLRGSADVRDLRALADASGRISVLDLSHLSISSFTEPFTPGHGNRYYEADALPPYIFFNSDFRYVVLPFSLKTICEGAFAASRIAGISFPPAIESVGDFAFYSASDLGKVTLPASITTIGKAAFKNCSSLSSLSLPDSSVSIGREAFAATGLSKVQIPASVSLGDFAFAASPALEEADMLSRSTSALALFACCDSLRSVRASSLSDIPPFIAAFSPHLNLQSTDIAPRSIADYAFAANDASVIILPSSVDSISQGAFAAMSSLREIYVNNLEARIPRTHPLAFEADSLASIILWVSKDSKNLWSEAIPWKYFDIKIFDASVPAIPSGSGSLSARIQAGSLCISSPSPWVSLSIFGIDGSLLVSSPAASSFSIPLPSRALSAYIIRASFENNRVETLKLLF